MPDDARSIITGFLRQYGLEALGAWAWDQYLNGSTVDQIMLDIRQRPEYQARFPAMEQLAQAGKAISEAEYIDYERTVKGLLQQYGIVNGMYDTPQGIAELLIKDVSAAEVNSRLQRAAYATFQAPEEAVTALRDRFGINSPGALMSWFLDPDKAMPLIEQQWAAAQITGAASRQRVALDVAEADRLSKQGISYEQAVQGFGQVAELERLGAGMGETADQRTVTRGVFGDQAEAARTRRVQQSRQSQFRGGGQAAETQEGVSGLGSASSR